MSGAQMLHPQQRARILHSLRLLDPRIEPLHSNHAAKEGGKACVLLLFVASSNGTRAERRPPPREVGGLLHRVRSVTA